jgi:DNA-binding PadR family transcriptional regulator
MTNETTCSLTDALALHGIGLTAAAANKVLAAAGVIAKRWRESGKPGRPPKSYWALTDLGKQFAVEEENSMSPEPTIRYRVDAFQALMAHVKPTLEMMLTEGEIAMKSATSKGQEAF